MMADVKSVYREYLETLGGRKNTAHEGRTEVCLVIEHLIRLHREVEGTSLTALGKQETITALEAVLRKANGREYIERLYDELDQWRQVRFKSADVPKDDAASSADASPADAPPQGPYTPPQVSVDRRSQSLASQEGPTT